MICLDWLKDYSCSTNYEIDNRWKDILTFGKIKGYHETDITKIYSKAMQEVESDTSDLDTIACVSATVLHLLEFHRCANWQTTANIVFARNEHFELGMTVADVLAFAEKHVDKATEMFVARCDCCEYDYNPHTMPGTKFPKMFDCDAPLVLRLRSLFGVNKDFYPSPSFMEYITYIKNLIENCGHRTGKHGTIFTKYMGFSRLSENTSVYNYYRVDEHGNKVEIAWTIRGANDLSFGVFGLETDTYSLAYKMKDVCNLDLKPKAGDSKTTKEFIKAYNAFDLKFSKDLKCSGKGEHPTTKLPIEIGYDLLNNKGHYYVYNKSGVLTSALKVINYEVIE